MIKPIAHLSWADRFGILGKMSINPTDTEICSVFKVSEDELKLARACLADNVFHINPRIEHELYEQVFKGENPTFPEFRTVRTRTIPVPPTEEEMRVLFAERIARGEDVKRGNGAPRRRSNNIEIAFRNVPSTPTDIEAFAKKYGVSVAVLRQHKRFDLKNSGAVFVRKNKQTGVTEIWRSLDGDNSN